MTTIMGAPGIETTDGEFRRAFVALAARMSVPVDDLAVVVSFESGFRPDAVNPNGGASGLIQFTPRTARVLGTTVEDIRLMSALEQLPLVEEFFRRTTLKPLRTLGDVYLAVFSPAFIGAPPETEMYAAADPDERKRRAYRWNRGLDLDDDGRIIVGEVVATIEAHKDRSRARPRVAVPAELSATGLVVSLVVGGLAAGAAWWLS